jgi:hypothetical protein
MFSNLQGCTSGNSRGNNANKTMDTLREREDNAMDSWKSLSLRQTW